MTASLDDYRWLTGDAAAAWLELAANELAAGMPLVRLTQRLRKELSAKRTHLVLSQVELRQRGREKFSLAEQMFFTPLGLSQATDEPLARYKAGRLLGRSPVADLCCGIGGDLIALGERGRCLGVDRDAITAHLAQVNAAACGLRDVSVECREASADMLAGCDAWHIDPDRRPEGRRTVRAERFDPPWETIELWLSRCSSAGVKLAPATQLAAGTEQRCEREWIESRGECRQQVAWFGGLARHGGQRAATRIDAAGGHASVVGLPDDAATAAQSVGRYVYEPCAAVRAARLTGAVGQQTGLAVLGGQGYLTADQPIDHPLLAGFEVLESLPFDLRRLKLAVRSAGIGPLEVKSRGAEADPDKLQRQLAQRDGVPGVVLIAPLGAKTLAIVGRRLASSPT